MRVTDPVCSMTFEQDEAAAQVEHEGRMYYFCTESCRKQFEKEPGRYAEAS